MYQVNGIYQKDDLEFKSKFSASVQNFIAHKYLKCICIQGTEDAGMQYVFHVLGTRKKLVTFSKIRESKKTFLLSYKGMAKLGIAGLADEYLLPAKVCEVLGEDREIYEEFNKHRTLRISQDVVDKYLDNMDELREYLVHLTEGFAEKIYLTDDNVRILAEYFINNKEKYKNEM